MKKILTFLVMLVACVSILSAQNAKFNYQAVVRDWNNNHILVQNETLNVEVKIYQGSQLVYTETLENKVTNFNGMVSFEIGAAQPVEEVELGEVQPGTISDYTQTQDQDQPTFVNRYTFDQIDWSNAKIEAKFMRGNDEICLVETPVMAVPYALQANVDPLEITTEKIVEYISHARGTDVNAIFQAMIQNTEVSNVLRDSIVNYIKTQDSLVKELAIYFLGTVNKNDVRDALAAIDETVKDTIKDLIVEYLKSTEGKAKAYDVIATYLQTTTETEVENLITDAKSNPNAHEIAEMLYNRSLNYLKTHKQLVKDVAYYFVTTFVDSQDVVDFHNYIKVKRPDIYNYMLTKLNGYLQYYLNDVYHALKDCQGTTVCDLQNEINNLKAQVAQCPTITSATYTIGENGGNTAYNFSVAITNLEPGTTSISSQVLKVKFGTNVLNFGNTNWNVANGVATIQFIDENTLIPATSDHPEFGLELTTDSCSSTPSYATATKVD